MPSKKISKLPPMPKNHVLFSTTVEFKGRNGVIGATALYAYPSRSHVGLSVVTTKGKRASGHIEIPKADVPAALTMLMQEAGIPPAADLGTILGAATPAGDSLEDALAALKAVRAACQVAMAHAATAPGAAISLTPAKSPLDPSIAEVRTVVAPAAGFVRYMCSYRHRSGTEVFYIDAPQDATPQSLTRVLVFMDSEHFDTRDEHELTYVPMHGKPSFSLNAEQLRVVNWINDIGIGSKISVDLDEGVVEGTVTSLDPKNRDEHYCASPRDVLTMTCTKTGKEHEVSYDRVQF